MESTSNQLENGARVATLALAAVPVVYMLGFLAWALHAASYGLGFLDLNQGRYVLVGLFVTLCIIGTLLIHWIALPRWARTHYKDKPIAKDGFEGFLNRFLFVYLSCLIGFIVPWVLGIGLRILQPELVQTLAAVLALGLGAAAAALLRTGTPTFLLRSDDSPKLPNGKPTVNAVPGDVPRKNHSSASGLAWVDKVFGATYWALYFVVIMGMLLLSGISADAGGGQPRKAWLDLDGDAFTETTLREIAVLPENATRPYGIVRSVDFNVLYHTGDSLMVRRTTDDLRSGKLWEIQVSNVSSITWLD